MEYESERFAINKLCEFSDRQTESEFMEYEKAASINIVRFLMLLMGFVFASFAISDYYYYGNENAFFFSLLFRSGALAVVVAVFSLADKIKRYSQTLLMITLTELLVFAIYLTNLYILTAREIALQFMSVMLFVLMVFLIPNKWKNSIIASLIIWAGYLIFSYALHGLKTTPSLLQRGIYLAITLVSCAIFHYGRESSQRKHFATEKLLEFVSITDRLTGIYNRGRFEHVLGLWIKNMRHDPFCLLLFDIDHFKSVNDHFGHVAGDEVLVSTTKTVSASIRDEDIFARWGGEEFVVLFSNIHLNTAVELAERLRKAVEANHCGAAGKITISIGVVQYHREEAIPDFVNRADAKMYEAKKAGRNQVVAETE